MQVLVIASSYFVVFLWGMFVGIWARDKVMRDTETPPAPPANDCDDIDPVRAAPVVPFLKIV